MRTTTSTLNLAAGQDGGYRSIAELRVYKPRELLTAWAEPSYPYTPTDDPGILEEPRPETVFYSTTIFKMVTILTEDDGRFSAMVWNGATERIIKQGTTALQSMEGCRAGAVNGFLFYLASDGNLKRATLSMTNLQTQEDMVTAQENVAAYDESFGSVVAISSTQCCVFYVDEGGIRFAYYEKVDSTWFEYRSPGRLFNPENLFTTGFQTTFSTAVSHSGYIRFYCTDIYRGNVYTIALDLENYEWGDIHEAIQSDLSDVRVVNAIVLNSHVHMTVQFARKEEWNTGETYNLLLHSESGKYFTMNRFTYFSRLGTRVHLIPFLGTTVFLLASLNRYNTWSMNADNMLTMAPNGTRLTIPGSDIIQIENTNNDVSTIVIANRSGEYADSEYLVKGAMIVLRTGYKTTAGDELVTFSTLRITEVPKEYIDQKAPIKIRAQADGTFFLQDLSSPYYAEIVGRTSKYDACEDLGNLYVAPGSGTILDSITVDFWNAKGFDNDGDPSITEKEIVVDGGPDIVIGPAIHKYGFRTDLVKTNAQLAGNPKVQAGDTVEIKLYGWCATTGSGTPTDTVSCYARFKSAETGLEYMSAGTLTSTYAKFPKNYNGTASGSYPIVWDLGATEDDELLYVGFVFEQSTGETTFLCECVEINGCSAADVNGIANTPWSHVTSESEDFISELEVPAVGEPFVMFSAQPYNPWNFQVIGDFYVSGEGGGDGQTEFGLCGLAEDALNMVFCRYIIQSATWQIVKLRNGVETVLASTVLESSTDTKVLFEHRDGEFAVYAYGYNYFEDPILTYSWEAADGPLATHEFNWHVGVRAGVLPEKFRIAGFDINDGEGIPFMGNYPTTVMTDLASSGEVSIDGVIYAYTGKTQSERPVGPYQGRSTYDWSLAVPYNNGNGLFSGIAVDMRWYAPEKTRFSKQDYFLAAENGHTWIIAETEWDPWTRTGGNIVQLRNRSRHFCDAAHGDLIGSSNRVCISPGLTGVTLVEGEAAMHSYGAWCYSRIQHTIRLRTFRATDGLHDTTVRDMIAQVVEVAGSKAHFPGDLTYASLVLTANTEEPIYP